MLLGCVVLNLILTSQNMLGLSTIIKEYRSLLEPFLIIRTVPVASRSVVSERGHSPHYISRGILLIVMEIFDHNRRKAEVSIVMEVFLLATAVLCIHLEAFLPQSFSGLLHGEPFQTPQYHDCVDNRDLSATILVSLQLLRPRKIVIRKNSVHPQRRGNLVGYSLLIRADAQVTREFSESDNASNKW